MKRGNSKKAAWTHGINGLGVVLQTRLATILAQAAVVESVLSRMVRKGTEQRSGNRWPQMAYRFAGVGVGAAAAELRAGVLLGYAPAVFSRAHTRVSN